MVGGLFLNAAFAAALLAVILFFLGAFRKENPAARFAPYVYAFGVLCVVTMSVIQMSNILNHRFEYTYIWSYSSLDLPLPLLISTFYAGQEGSFMLWTLYISVVGLILMRYAAKKGYVMEVMAVYGMIQVFLLLLLEVKNPFKFVWDSFPGQVSAGFQPANGRGLNPLLQNFWMVIHPPILFMGFTSMAFPYAHAVAALIRRNYTQWIRAATPWTVFSSLALGTGIILGGYWAYETLGWGGYWGWDPVENSSLVPWLVSVASIHTMLSQRKSGSFVRTNLVMALLGFLLVMYSTFLTRSGVLGDTSVHSFVDPGMFAYVLLVAGIAFFAIVPVDAFFLGALISSARARKGIRMAGQIALSLVFVLCAITPLGIIQVEHGDFVAKLGSIPLLSSYIQDTTLPRGVFFAILGSAALIDVSIVVYKIRKTRKLLRTSGVEIPKVPVRHSVLSREFALLLGACTLTAVALLVALGTSSPLITGIIDGKPSAVDTSYYAHTTVPLGVAIALLAGTGQLLWWNRSNKLQFLKSLLGPLGFAFGATLALFLLGMRLPEAVVLGFAAIFSLAANVRVGFRIIRGNPGFAGGALAHIGIAILLLGVIGSAYYNEKQTIMLDQGKNVSVFGYDLKYLGTRSLQDRNKRYAFDVLVHDRSSGREYTLSPIMYQNTQGEGIMRNPDIVNMVTKDFYLSPLSLETSDTPNPDESRLLLKDQPQSFDGMEVTFRGFNLSDKAREAMMTGGDLKIGVLLDVRRNGKIEHLEPAFVKKGDDASYVPARIPGTAITLSVVKMHPNQNEPEKSSVDVGVLDSGKHVAATAPTETLVIEASLKPYINFVWIGTLTLLSGFIMTILRRVREARVGAVQTATDEPAQSVKAKISRTPIVSYEKNGSPYRTPI